MLLDEALEAAKAVHGAVHTSAESLYAKKANLFTRLRRFPEALGLYQKALAIAEEVGSDSVRLGDLRTSIAGILKEQGEFQKALPLYHKSLQDKIQALGPSHITVAISLANIADLHLRVKEPMKAMPLYEQARSVMEAERGLRHPEVATILSSMASCYTQLEK